MWNRTLGFALVALLWASSGCSEEPAGTAGQQATASSATGAAQLAAVFDVYKSPTCGCCGKWVDIAKAAGLETRIHHPEDLSATKTRFRIDAPYRSCHTVVSPDGYVFEGHVPVELMERFLAERPKDAIGLAVPGMPVGSPGMEVGDRRDSYDVLMLRADGSATVYAHIAGNAP